MKPPLCAAHGIHKSFGGSAALRGVDLVLDRGEIVALVGENGAGKSTLAWVLAGRHRPDAGVLRLDGQPVAFASTMAARRAGVALVPQEPLLGDNLTVEAALFLGDELRRGPWLRRRAMRAAASAALARLGLGIAPAARISELGPGERQLVALARALLGRPRVLVLDEPTSSLTPAEAGRLLTSAREFAAGGGAVLYVSHRLAEIRAVADRAVGLCDGRGNGEVRGAELDAAALVRLMGGRGLESPRRPQRPRGEVALRLRGVRTGRWPARAIDLDVAGGEIVGLAGLLGAGRSELLRAVFGIDPRCAGSVEVRGRRLPPGRPAAAIAAGLGFVPEDRWRQGLLPGASVAQNLALATLRSRGLWLDCAYERQLAARMVATLGIAAAGPGAAIETLSGGNQQKVVLGRWLAAAPAVLLLDEPTRGVDLGARADLHARIHELAATGTAVLFASSEVDELLALADRVVVLCCGGIAGELAGAARDEAAILALAATGARTL